MRSDRAASVSLRVTAGIACALLWACAVHSGDSDSAGAADAAASLDAGTARDAAPNVDASSLCSESGQGCTCTSDLGGLGCTHSLGGLYADRACTGGFQCCAGLWRAGAGACGACVCTDATGQTGCAADTAALHCFPAFDGVRQPIPAAVAEQMRGASWHEGIGCPDLAALALLDVPHWGFDGDIHRGQLVVAQAVAADMLGVFRELYEREFPIEKMRLVHHYGGDDDASMADNNTSAFNCRRVTGGTTLSQHSFGTAIDINPVQNPYVKGAAVLPPAGAGYQDRADVRPGMIVAPGHATYAFGAIGWGWGGNFSSLKDYQHFSQSGN